MPGDLINLVSLTFESVGACLRYFALAACGSLLMGLIIVATATYCWLTRRAGRSSSGSQQRDSDCRGLIISKTLMKEQGFRHSENSLFMDVMRSSNLSSTEQ